MVKASSSVLKLVRNIHRIGRKIRNPKNQAALVDTHTRLEVTLRAIVSSLQIPSDDPHQEERHDVGDHDRDQSAGRGVSNVELYQGLRVDQERDIGRLQARTAARR